MSITARSGQTWGIVLDICRLSSPLARPCNAPGHMGILAMSFLQWLCGLLLARICRGGVFICCASPFLQPAGIKKVSPPMSWHPTTECSETIERCWLVSMHFLRGWSLLGHAHLRPGEPTMVVHLRPHQDTGDVLAYLGLCLRLPPCMQLGVSRGILLLSQLLL